MIIGPAPAQKAASRANLKARPGLVPGIAMCGACPLLWRYIKNQAVPDGHWASPVWVYIWQCEQFFQLVSRHLGWLMRHPDEQATNVDRDCGGWGQVANILNEPAIKRNLNRNPQYGEIMPWLLYYFHCAAFWASTATRRWCRR